eukprot:2256176-Amphidinium_carterae.1
MSSVRIDDQHHLKSPRLDLVVQMKGLTAEADTKRLRRALVQGLHYGKHCTILHIIDRAIGLRRVSGFHCTLNLSPKVQRNTMACL